MPRRLRKRETTDAFSEFLAEHPGLWPPRQPRGDAGDPLSEFVTEVEPVDDRWLAVARGRKTTTTPKLHDYRHMLAVASVVLSVITPAGVISSVIVGRALAVSPLSALPPLPAGLLESSVDRLVGVPTVNLPSPPDLSDESRLTEPPPPPLPPRPAQRVGAASAPVRAEPAPMAVLPLTTALLSSPGPEVKLTSAPPPVRSNPPTAASVAPVTPAAPAPAPPPPSTPPEAASAGRPAVPNPATETAAVRVVLDRYRDAFSSLDVGSAKSVWPAVDERMLERAFNQMTTQQFTFDSCNIDVTGARATASCRGRAQFVPKVGSRTPRLEPRQWTFTLRRAERDWSIESVDSR